MEILKKAILLIFLITMSCSVKQNPFNNSDSKVILYKQVSTGTDAEFSFEKKSFWDTNFKNHTFIYQKFENSQYQDIINKVKTQDFKSNVSPEYYNSVIYAFVVEQKNKKNNDTVYYDGTKRWWIKEKGIMKLYLDKETKLTEELKLAYPIFRSCGYNN